MQYQNKFQAISLLSFASFIVIQSPLALAMITKSPSLVAGTPVTETFKVSMKTSLNIKNDGGSISIVGNETDQLEVQATLLCETAGLKMSIVDSETGSVQIRIVTPASGPSSQRYFNGGMVVLNSCDGNGALVDLVIRVPRKLVGNVKIETRGADIQIESLEGAGTFEINGGSSSLAVSQVKADSYDVNLGSGHSVFISSSGSVNVNSGSGGAEFKNYVGKISTNSGSGRVEAVDTEGEVRIHTGSGAVEVTRNKGTSVQVNTERGAITVTGQEGGNIHLETQRGAQITTNNPLAVNQTIITSAPMRYRDLAGKWLETQTSVAAASGMSSSVNMGSQVVVDGRVVTGAEAARIQEQVMRSLAAAFGGGFNFGNF